MPEKTIEQLKAEMLETEAAYEAAGTAYGDALAAGRAKKAADAARSAAYDAYDDAYRAYLAALEAQENSND